MDDDDAFMQSARDLAKEMGCTVQPLDFATFDAICKATAARTTRHYYSRLVGCLTVERGYRAMTTLLLFLPRKRAVALRLWGDRHRHSLIFWINHNPGANSRTIDGTWLRPWGWVWFNRGQWRRFWPDILGRLAVW